MKQGKETNLASYHLNKESNALHDWPRKNVLRQHLLLVLSLMKKEPERDSYPENEGVTLLCRYIQGTALAAETRDPNHNAPKPRDSPDHPAFGPIMADSKIVIQHFKETNIPQLFLNDLRTIVAETEAEDWSVAVTIKLAYSQLAVSLSLDKLHANLSQLNLSIHMHRLFIIIHCAQKIENQWGQAQEMTCQCKHYLRKLEDDLPTYGEESSQEMLTIRWLFYHYLNSTFDCRQKVIETKPPRPSASHVDTTAQENCRAYLYATSIMFDYYRFLTDPIKQKRNTPPIFFERDNIEFIANQLIEHSIQCLHKIPNPAIRKKTQTQLLITNWMQLVYEQYATCCHKNIIAHLNMLTTSIVSKIEQIPELASIPPSDLAKSIIYYTPNKSLPELLQPAADNKVCPKNSLTDTPSDLYNIFIKASGSQRTKTYELYQAIHKLPQQNISYISAKESFMKIKPQVNLPSEKIELIQTHLDLCASVPTSNTITLFFQSLSDSPFCYDLSDDGRQTVDTASKLHFDETYYLLYNNFTSHALGHASAELQKKATDDLLALLEGLSKCPYKNNQRLIMIIIERLTKHIKQGHQPKNPLRMQQALPLTSYDWNDMFQSQSCPDEFFSLLQADQNSRSIFYHNPYQEYWEQRVEELRHSNQSPPKQSLAHAKKHDDPSPELSFYNGTLNDQTAVRIKYARSSSIKQSALALAGNPEINLEQIQLVLLAPIYFFFMMQEGREIILEDNHHSCASGIGYSMRTIIRKTNLDSKTRIYEKFQKKCKSLAQLGLSPEDISRITEKSNPLLIDLHEWRACYADEQREDLIKIAENDNEYDHPLEEEALAQKFNSAAKKTRPYDHETDHGTLLNQKTKDVNSAYENQVSNITRLLHKLLEGAPTSHQHKVVMDDAVISAATTYMTHLLPQPDCSPVNNEILFQRVINNLLNLPCEQHCIDDLCRKLRENALKKNIITPGVYVISTCHWYHHTGNTPSSSDSRPVARRLSYRDDRQMQSPSTPLQIDRLETHIMSLKEKVQTFSNDPTGKSKKTSHPSFLPPASSLSAEIMEPIAQFIQAMIQNLSHPPPSQIDPSAGEKSGSGFFSALSATLPRPISKMKLLLDERLINYFNGYILKALQQLTTWQNKRITHQSIASDISEKAPFRDICNWSLAKIQLPPASPIATQSRKRPT